MHKRFENGELKICGYKSRECKMIKVKHGGQTVMTEGGEINPDGAHISFREGHFKFDIKGKENLENLKEIIEFALKIENEEVNIPQDNVPWNSWSDLPKKLRNEFESEIQRNNDMLNKGEIESVELTDNMIASKININKDKRNKG